MDGAGRGGIPAQNGLYTLTKIYVKTRKQRDKESRPPQFILPRRASQKKLPPLPFMRSFEDPKPSARDLGDDPVPRYWQSPRIFHRKLGVVNRLSRFHVDDAYLNTHMSPPQTENVTLQPFPVSPRSMLQYPKNLAPEREKNLLWVELVNKIMMQQRVIGAFLGRKADYSGDKKASWANIVHKLHIHTNYDRGKRIRAHPAKRDSDKWASSNQVQQLASDARPTYISRPQNPKDGHAGRYGRNTYNFSSKENPTMGQWTPEKSPWSQNKRHLELQQTYASLNHSGTVSGAPKTIFLPAKPSISHQLKLQPKVNREATHMNTVNMGNFVDLQVTGFSTYKRHHVNVQHHNSVNTKYNLAGSAIPAATTLNYGIREGKKPSKRTDFTLMPDILKYRPSYDYRTKYRGAVSLEVPTAMAPANRASITIPSLVSNTGIGKKLSFSKDVDLYSQSRVPTVEANHEKPVFCGSPEPRAIGSPEPGHSDDTAGEISIAVPSLPRIQFKESAPKSESRGFASPVSAELNTNLGDATNDPYEPVVIITNVEGKSVTAEAWPTDSSYSLRSPSDGRESGYLSAPSSSKLSERSKSRGVSRLSTITSSSGGFLEVPFANFDSRAHSPASSFYSDTAISRSASRLSALTTASSNFLAVPNFSLNDMDGPRSRFPVIGMSYSQPDLKSTIDSDGEGITIPLPTLVRHSKGPGDVT